jgi:hypothetical protein
MGAEQRERFAAFCSYQDSVALQAQRAPDGLAQRAIIVHEQNAAVVQHLISVREKSKRLARVPYHGYHLMRHRRDARAG